MRERDAIEAVDGTPLGDLDEARFDAAVFGQRAALAWLRRHSAQSSSFG